MHMLWYLDIFVQKLSFIDIVIFCYSISSRLVRQAIPITSTQEDLDVKCLQILRALIHNEERRLPEDWESRTAEKKIKKYKNF